MSERIRGMDDGTGDPDSDLELGFVDAHGRLLSVSPAWLRRVGVGQERLGSLFGGSSDELENALSRAFAGEPSILLAPLARRHTLLRWHFESADSDRIRVLVAPQQPTPDIARILYDKASVGLALTDHHGRLLHTNASCARIFGRPRADLIERRFTELLQRADRDWARRQHARLIETGACPDRMEYVIRRPNGEQRLIHVDQHHVEFAEGTGSLTTITDITHERHHERQLTDSERQLRDLMNTIPGAIFRFRYAPEEGYSLERMSDGVREITGFGVDTDIADFEIWKRHMPEEAVTPYLESIERSRKHLSEWSYEWPMDVPAGRIWLQAFSTPHEESDGVIIWNGLLFDVTLRKQAEERLDRIETDYQHFFDHTNEGMYISSPAGRLLDVNWPLVEMHRCRTKQELIERIESIERDWYVEPDAAARLRREIEVTDTIEDFHAEVYRAGSGEVFLSIENARAVRDKSGEVQYFQGTVRDITEGQLIERLTTRRSDILEMIARGVPLNRVTHEIAITIEGYQSNLRAAVCQLYGQNLNTEAAPRVDPRCIKVLDSGSVDTSTGAIGEAIRVGRCVTESETASSIMADAMRESGYEELLVFPVLNQDGNPLGLLAVFAASSETVDVSAQMLLEEMSHITAIAFEQNRLIQQLIEQAQYDPLTGLPNRTLLQDRLQQLSFDADRKGSPFAVLMLDLDDFKIVNDTLGHSSGDRLLTEVSARLLDCIRGGDTVARFGGDEFVVAVPLSTPVEASNLAARILERLQPPIEIGEQELYVRASIGISIYPQDGATPDLMLQSADTAMYSAKRAGRNQYHYFSDAMNERFAGRLRIERQLRSALEQEELVLFFQPRVFLGDHSIYGAEVLLRWVHPDSGLLGPGEFLPIAEQSSLIGEIDQYVVRHAALKIAQLQSAGHELLISVNISALLLERNNFAELIADDLAAAGVQPSGLELEITETVLMHDFEHASQQLRRLRTLAPGVRIALDDFGAGYSSLQYLRQLPIDTLKIDRGFILDLTTANENGSAYSIVRTIVELAHSLGLSVIAEGVETADQIRILQEIGCDEAQGFWFSPAIDSESFFANMSADCSADAFRAQPTMSPVESTDRIAPSE